jgi:hypothetical protein
MVDQVAALSALAVPKPGRSLPLAGAARGALDIIRAHPRANPPGQYRTFMR